MPVKGEWLDRGHGDKGAPGGQVFVRLAVAVGFREWGSEGSRGLSECFIPFFNRFKDEGLHEGDRKKIKNRRLGNLQGYGLRGTGGPQGAHSSSVAG